MGRLAGKTALITGASRGQGAAEPRLFAAEKCRWWTFKGPNAEVCSGLH